MNITIIYTNSANILAIFNTIKNLGYNIIISNSYDKIISSDKILIPGVGTISTAIKTLRNHFLINLLKNIKNPILGICLGMQLLGNKSEENNKIKALNIIKENIIKFKNNLPIPHMGWNKIYIKKNHYIYKNISDGTYFYFVHKYIFPLCLNTIGITKYGIMFSSIISKDNYIGVQFHPERSGIPGRKLLKNYLDYKN